MSNEVITYDQAPTDLVTEITAVARGGIKNVLAYSMAIDKLPEEDKAARREAIKDHRSKSNLEFLTMFVGTPKTRLVIARDSVGEPIRNSNGDVVMEEVPMAHPYQQLIDQLVS
ncbi:hypothetical protein SEA_CRUNCHYBOI_33 [Microbacterium phage CrunchyBoi]|nr:hypothetical protein SEA_PINEAPPLEPLUTO_33 [Microbacterium phage PineapplePluto]QQO39376.1 hypothetical protein SEA_CRUNCHYBOI_33 [Microbacterium phage CrunchyBoi]